MDNINITLENVSRSPKKAGRKPKHSPAEIEILKAEFLEYIETNEFPKINEFAYMKRINRQLLYENKELRELTELANLKKTAAYEKGMIDGSLQTAGCIFALKQHGWKDRQEVETVIIDKKKAKRELEKLFE
jgi:hypothetical protein